SSCAIARLVAATSSAKEVRGFCTAITLYPFAWSLVTTLDQLLPSANAPCTKTMFLTPLIPVGVAALSGSAVVATAVENAADKNCLIVIIKLFLLLINKKTDYCD